MDMVRRTEADDQNFAALSKGGTQQVSLMNIAMELKKAS